MTFIPVVVEDEGLLRLNSGDAYDNGMKPPVTCMTFDSFDEAKYNLVERQQQEPATCLLQIDGELWPNALWLTADQFEAGIQAPLVRAGCAKVPYDFKLLRSLDGS